MARTTESELNLIEQAKTNPEAFGQLYEIYVDRIYSYIYYRTGSQADAEDLTARTFFRALDSIGRYVHRGLPFSAWLYRIAHNLVANWLRDRGRRKFVSLEDVTAIGPRGKSPDVHAEDNERRGELVAAVRRLPEDRQQLILLKFVERLPNAEIGEMMGRTEGAIKSLYHRTLIALREDLATRSFHW